jgi:hypothetical protein
MEENTEVTPEVAETPVGVNVAAVIAGLFAQIKPTIARGDDDEVNLLRLKIKVLRDAVLPLSGEFDGTIKAVRESGFKGSDFLASVELFRKVSEEKPGRKAAPKPAIDPRALFI